MSSAVRPLINREIFSTIAKLLFTESPSFSGNLDNKLKFIIHFLPVLKTVPWYDCTSKETSFWAITIKSGLAQQKKKIWKLALSVTLLAHILNLRFINE